MLNEDLKETHVKTTRILWTIWLRQSFVVTVSQECNIKGYTGYFYVVHL